MTYSHTQTELVHEIKNGKITIPKDTDLTYIALLTKGWNETKTLDFNFEGENSTLNFLAFIIGKNEEKFSFKTNSNHSSPNTNSTYTVRSVMYDASEIDYTGALNIKPGTKDIGTRLAHHTLLLSKDAKVKTTPSLEIEANDVKASHAATVGRINEDLLFYLTTRCLDVSTAKDLMIRGFLKSDLEKIEDSKLRDRVTKELNLHLV